MDIEVRANNRVVAEYTRWLSTHEIDPVAYASRFDGSTTSFQIATTGHRLNDASGRAGADVRVFNHLETRIGTQGGGYDDWWNFNAVQPQGHTDGTRIMEYIAGYGKVGRYPYVADVTATFRRWVV